MLSTGPDTLGNKKHDSEDYTEDKRSEPEAGIGDKIAGSRIGDEVEMYGDELCHQQLESVKPPGRVKVHSLANCRCNGEPNRPGPL